MLMVMSVATGSTFSQTKQATISGLVLNSSKTPLEAATVILFRSKDTAVVKINTTDKNGQYSFGSVTDGNYYVQVSAVGYTTLRTPPFDIFLPGDLKQLAPIVLQVQQTTLAGVTVTAKKALVEQKIDRVLVNVDAAITNVGSTALEVLEKSPGISVDKDGKIALKGKSEVLVMIDNKPTYLSSAELANLLSSMNASQLSQIEIITNPSARYDASGNGGIINIKTKKNTSRGFNGSLGLTYGQGAYPKSNGSLLLNYKTDKFNAFLNYNYVYTKNFMDVIANRSFLDENNQLSYLLNQNTRNISVSKNNTLKLGIDYYLNQETSIGFSASGFIAPQAQMSGTTSNLETATKIISSVVKTDRTVNNTWKNGTLNLNFHRSFDSSHKDLSGSFDLLKYSFAGDQTVIGNSFDANGQLVSASALLNLLPLDISIYSGRTDFSETTSDGIKIESGIKSSVVTTSNASTYYDASGGAILALDSLSNRFSYSENINAAYINLSKKIGALTVQAGLRAENTNYKGIERDAISDSSFSRSFTNLFPSAFLAYQINDDHLVALSAGRRIDRPAYQQLNPFISIIDKYMQLAGNPYLKPQYSNSIELAHTWRNMFTTTVNYTVVHDIMSETLIRKDSLIIRNTGNIGTRTNVGISESATIPISKWYTGTYFVNLYKNNYKGVIDNYPFYAKQLAISFNLVNQFSLKKGWSAELSGSYTSRTRDEGQAIALPIGNISAGLSKSLLNNKANLKFNVRDIFYTNVIREIQDFQNVRSDITRSRDSRFFNISFTWRFGVQPRAKAVQQTEEQKRILLN